MRPTAYALRVLAALVVAGIAEYLLTTLTDAQPGTVFLLANTFATPTNVLRRVARRLTNNCVFTGTVMRGYDEQYRLHGVKQGDTIKSVKFDA